MDEDPYADLLKELRGPVASIESYVRTLIARDEDLAPPARSTIHQVILQQAQRLDVFVEDVVLYVRLLTGGVAVEAEPLMLGAVVEEARHQLGEPDRVEVTGADVVVRSDRAALGSVLRRLVRNAEAYYRAMYYGSAESWNLRDRHMFGLPSRSRRRCGRQHPGGPCREATRESRRWQIARQCVTPWCPRPAPLPGG